ncbi:lantibiotic dehydratase C-terminal domain-containing protein, partial [Actinosynnema sp. NPDC023658]|uniref:lantibiotic dehydratase C-terminal domain-containing protein n=1 Tax=Actinosynnema sp. NPDC023658 TaxID=3155465 RepID=UPI003401716D
MVDGTRNWVGAHVFHRGDQDLLIARALAPLCAELTRAGALDEWFIHRYWEGGAHVRLRLCTTSPADAIRAAVV